MIPLKKLLIFLVLVALVSGTAAFLASRTSPKKIAARDRTSDIHDWIHSQLVISPEQHKILEPMEQSFHQQRQHLLEIIRLGDMELAQAILKDKGNSPDVLAAMEKIHQAQGELQKSLLTHLFDMRQALTPEQYDKLLNLTADSLYNLELDQ